MHGVVLRPWRIEWEVDVFQGSTYPSYHYFYLPLAVTASSIRLHSLGVSLCWLQVPKCEGRQQTWNMKSS